MQQFNAKQGIFGPGGHGGGIFQTTVSGLGSPDGLGGPLFNVKGGIFGPGGHGGGIFQTTVMGLGATDVGPRGVKSEKTLSIQVSLNEVLPRIGRSKVTVDGVLGNETCSAIAAVVQSGKFKGWTVPSACATGGGAAPMPSPAPATMETYEFQPPMSTGKKLAIAGAGVLVAVGGYMVWKKIW